MQEHLEEILYLHCSARYLFEKLYDHYENRRCHRDIVMASPTATNVWKVHTRDMHLTY